MDLYNSLFAKYLNSKNSPSTAGVDLLSGYFTYNGTYYPSKSNEAFNVVSVDVQYNPTPQGTLYISEAGKHDVRYYSAINVLNPVTNYASRIVKNGVYNIREYEYADVNVPIYEFPSGTLNISSNGIYNVNDYENASVRIGKDRTGTVVSNLNTHNADQGDVNRLYVKFGDTIYYTVGETFSYKKNEKLSCCVHGKESGYVYVNGEEVFEYDAGPGDYIYEFILPDNDINVTFKYDVGSSGSIAVAKIYINYVDKILRVSNNGRVNVQDYDFVNANVYGAVAAGELSVLNKTVSGYYSNSRITQLGAYAFYYCSKLTQVEFPNVTSIGDYAFYLCYNLSSCSFPSAISIGAYAFNSCNKLSEFNFSTINTVGEYAFRLCSNLVSVDLMSVSSLGSGAFNHCFSLKTVTAYDISEINRSTFYRCSSLDELNFSPTVYKIDSDAFTQCSSLQSIEFQNVSYIGTSAFTSCKNLKTASFPSVKEIGQFAFYTCYSLSYVNIDSVLYLRDSCFEHCINLQSISLPNVMSIGHSTFYDCSKLKSVYILNSSICTLYDNRVFELTPLSGTTADPGSIFVKQSLVDAYKSATNWINYSNRITAFIE